MKNPIRRTEETPVKAPEADRKEPESTSKTCKIAGCEEDDYVRGLCWVHWMTHRGLADPQEKHDD